MNKHVVGIAVLLLLLLVDSKGQSSSIAAKSSGKASVYTLFPFAFGSTVLDSTGLSIVQDVGASIRKNKEELRDFDLFLNGYSCSEELTVDSLVHLKRCHTVMRQLCRVSGYSGEEFAIVAIPEDLGYSASESICTLSAVQLKIMKRCK